MMLIHKSSRAVKGAGNPARIEAITTGTIVLAENGDDGIEADADLIIRLPHTSTLLQPLVATVPLQLLACELATELGHDVDQPRNLAKSVTVE